MLCWLKKVSSTSPFRTPVRALAPALGTRLPASSIQRTWTPERSWGVPKGTKGRAFRALPA